jgi:hypothetical protein
MKHSFCMFLYRIKLHDDKWPSCMHGDSFGLKNGRSRYLKGESRHIFLVQRCGARKFRSNFRPKRSYHHHRNNLYMRKDNDLCQKRAKTSVRMQLRWQRARGSGVIPLRSTFQCLLQLWTPTI